MIVSPQEAPIITDLGNGLRVGYLIDQGTHYQHVQRLHLDEAELTEAASHQRAVDNLAWIRRCHTEQKCSGVLQCQVATGVKALHEIIEDAKGKTHPIMSTLYWRDPATRTWRPYQ